MNPIDADSEPGDTKEKTKLPAQAHFLCGWPLVLVLVGGAIGGALGGAAYYINLTIYKSDLPTVAKVLLNLAVGFAAFVLWFVIALAITVAMNRE